MGSLSKAEKMDDTTLLSNDVTKIKSELHKQEKYKYLCIFSSIFNQKIKIKKEIYIQTTYILWEILFFYAKTT